ncbi:hypothetical protein HYPDE_41118 [Hyphomicrobium denitrificans 1NES1]|uniref:Uncharacterized protein n=1 Tax=Hyphomicrobium denitrificans 1NES1 TaxID=670307 RepID=N0BCC8_9HYPH|nr:hypothetical protein HYPDE_41118 [Hyphomicrobium denitrificans 1NES1]
MCFHSTPMKHCPMGTEWHRPCGLSPPDASNLAWKIAGNGAATLQMYRALKSPQSAAARKPGYAIPHSGIPQYITEIGCDKANGKRTDT